MGIFNFQLKPFTQKKIGCIALRAGFYGSKLLTRLNGSNSNYWR